MMEVSELIEMLRLARENRDPEDVQSVRDAWPALEIGKPGTAFTPIGDESTDSPALRSVKQPERSSAPQ